MEIKQNVVPTSKYPLKCPNPMTPIGICVHNTANDASAKNEISYMVGNDKQTSFHLAVDNVEVWQGLPLDRNGWHAGDGATGIGNRKYIGIEICYSKSGGEKFHKAEDNAAQLIADMLKERNWGIDKVKKHQDFSGKYCPHRTLDLGWDRFIKMVEAKLGGNMDCLIANNKEGSELFTKLVHNSSVADQTVVYLGLGQNADGVDFNTIKNSLEAREGKLTSCKNELSTRDSDLAKANSEIKNRVEQISRLQEQLTICQSEKKDADTKLKDAQTKHEEEMTKANSTVEHLQSKLNEEAKAKGRALNDLAECQKKLENALKNQYPDLTLGSWLALLATIKWR